MNDCYFQQVLYLQTTITGQTKKHRRSAVKTRQCSSALLRGVVQSETKKIIQTYSYNIQTLNLLTFFERAVWTGKSHVFARPTGACLGVRCQVLYIIDLLQSIWGGAATHFSI